MPNYDGTCVNGRKKIPPLKKTAELKKSTFSKKRQNLKKKNSNHFPKNSRKEFDFFSTVHTCAIVSNCYINLQNGSSLNNEWRIPSEFVIFPKVLPSMYFIAKHLSVQYK